MEGNEQLAIIIPMLKKVGGGIGDGQLTAPTPCRAFDVTGILGHMTGLGSALALGFLGTTPDATGEATSPGASEDPRDGFQEAMDALLEAVESPGALDRTIDGPAGPMPGSVLARLVALDGLIHGWDLATATQQVWAPPADIVAEADAFARQALTPEMRGEAFAPETAPPGDAGPLERLVAFTGREVG